MRAQLPLVRAQLPLALVGLVGLVAGRRFVGRPLLSALLWPNTFAAHGFFPAVRAVSARLRPGDVLIH